MARAVSKPYMSNPDDLKKWFLDQEIPFFKVYTGHGKPGSVGSDNLVEDNPDIAVEALLSYLNMNYVPGGQFTINLIPDPNKTNAGLKKQLFQWPMTESTTSINGTQQTQGINRSEMQLMLDNQRMQWQIDQLEAEIASAGTEDLKGVAINMIKEHAPQILGIFGALLGPKAAAVAANGIYGPAEQVPAVDLDLQDVEPLTEEETVQSFENSMTILKDHFGADLVPIFAKLAAYVDKDPAKAKNVLNTFL